MPVRPSALAQLGEHVVSAPTQRVAMVLAVTVALVVTPAVVIAAIVLRGAS